MWDEVGRKRVNRFMEIRRLGIKVIRGKRSGGEKGKR